MAGKSVNKVILIGNLGKDPEVKYTPQGTPVAKITLATNERYKDKNGEWQDRTEWHNVVLWQRLAEIAGEYLKKGGKVYIEGRLQTRSWDDKQTNQKKYMTEVVASDLVLLGGRGEGAGGGDSAAVARRSAAATISINARRKPSRRQLHRPSAMKISRSKSSLSSMQRGAPSFAVLRRVGAPDAGGEMRPSSHSTSDPYETPHHVGCTLHPSQPTSPRLSQTSPPPP